MTRETDRPARPAPLRLDDEESKAEWRDYMRACALADEALMERTGSLKGRLI
ncbi:MAG: hypothetical protein AAF526_03840 [Pseudomonadota bacterium]